MEEKNIERRWSTAFWLKKLLWLLGIILMACLIVWLLDYDDDKKNKYDDNDDKRTSALDTDGDGIDDYEDDDDDNDGYSDEEENIANTDSLDAASYPGPSNTGDGVDTDGDGVEDELDDDDDNDGHSDAEEILEGTNPLDADSYPTDHNHNNGSLSVDIPGYTGTPTISSVIGADKCAHTYNYGTSSTLTIYDNCLPSEPLNTDWLWTHDATANVTNSPLAYDCSGATLIGAPCTHGNGILEVWSMDQATQDMLTGSGDIPSDFVVFYFTDQDGANETNATTILKPIIESFSRN